jgi:exodeoxyribonuclease VII small subunit
MADDRSNSFEASLQRLEAIVRTLEADDTDLERAVNLYAEGKALVARCEEQLKDAQRKIEATSAPAPARAPEGAADDAE